GSFGSALAILVFYPLERVRVELQSQGGGEVGTSVERDDGKRTLYKGASHMATTLMISNFIFFYALQVTKRTLTSISGDEGDYHQQKENSKIGTSLLASSLAGAINVFLTNPLWVASLRIMESKGEGGSIKQHKQMQQQPTLWAVIHGIATKEGIPQLWSGTLTSLLLVSNPIIQHFLYDHLRIWLFERRRRHNTAHSGGDGRHAEAFAFGAMSKTVATVVTYPLQLAQVLLRLQSKKLPSTPDGKDDHTTSHEATATVEYNGMIDCLYQQFTAGGVPAMFKGMNAKLLQTVLTAAFTFLTYEQTLVLVGRL
ncbi:THAPSDRAFT_261623, partial [Thalassiosira pseudonana CCMP1335]